MRSLKQLWNEFTIFGKLMSWFYIPTYYLTLVAIAVFIIVFNSVLDAYDDANGIKRG